MPCLGRNLFSTQRWQLKKVSKLFSLRKAPLFDLGLFSVQSTRSDNLDYLDLAIKKKVNGQSWHVALFWKKTLRRLY